MSSENTLIAAHQACFQLKALFSPCTLFCVTHYDLNALEKQLAEKIRLNPNFFQNTPVVIDLEKVATIDINFERIKELLLRYQLIPIGIRNASERQKNAAALTGLPSLQIGKSSVNSSATIYNNANTNSNTNVNTNANVNSNVKSNNTKVNNLNNTNNSNNLNNANNTNNRSNTNNANNINKNESELRNETKMITHPVRSGMQIYAKNADLVVTSAVSPGAEIMADGNIHIYGPLRGKALAGMQGNKQAKIFCRHLDAELVAVAGYYLTKEERPALSTSTQSTMLQIYLENDQIKIDEI